MNFEAKGEKAGEKEVSVLKYVVHRIIIIVYMLGTSLYHIHFASKWILN